MCACFNNASFAQQARETCDYLSLNVKRKLFRNVLVFHRRHIRLLHKLCAACLWDFLICREEVDITKCVRFHCSQRACDSDC